MRNITELKNWFFIQANLTRKNEVVDKIRAKKTITSLNMELKPFNVPGTLQSNLAEILSINPYYEENMRFCDDCENDVIILLCEIIISDVKREHNILFEWIDTAAEIYLNGELIDRTSNAFIAHKILLPLYLQKQGANLISVVLSPAMSYVNEKASLPEIRDRVFLRRPAYNYGWDFAPRAVLTGIGKVKFYEKQDLCIKNVFVVIETLSEAEVDLLIEWDTETQHTTYYSFNIKIKDKQTQEIRFCEEFLQNLKSGLNHSVRKIHLLNPSLWWPNGYGNQPLYELEITEKSTRSSAFNVFGIRSIKLIQNENNNNRFIFEINGRKIFVKGANWVPTDALTNYSDPKKYKKLLELAKNANFNMLRVWGGGVVEKKVFYQICDELGLMLWHDFNFACSIYPEDADFLTNVEEEVKSILIRLRNHPSIVLWCGNNENEWIYCQNFPNHYKDGVGIGYELHKLKNRLCSEYDPTRPYWRSSPWSVNGRDPNSQNDGNCHDWYVWHGLGFEEPPQYEYYAENRAKFITEFGIQSFPIKSTIDRIFSKVTQETPNEIWEFHNFNPQKIETNLKKFGIPKNIDEWILFTQAAQAFGMKYAIEVWRSRKFENAGVLIWQYNEPWPTICWSLVDYFNKTKMSYWFVKRAYNPVIVAYNTLTEKIVIVNDLDKILKGKVLISRFNLTANQENELLSTEVIVKANDKLNLPNVKIDLRENEVIHIIFRYEDNQSENIILPKDPIGLDFANPQISSTLHKENRELTLLADRFSFIVVLPEELEPQDNYFHLYPNVPYTIKLNNLPQSSTIELSIWNYKRRIVEINTSI